MKTALLCAALAASALLSMPVPAAEGLSGAQVNPDAGKRAGGRAMSEERCRQDPERCRQIKERLAQRRAECEANPEQCREQRKAAMRQRFARADANGDGALSRDEAERGMPRVARNFDRLDANKDGRLTPDELAAAARKGGQGKGGPRGGADAAPGSNAPR